MSSVLTLCSRRSTTTTCTKYLFKSRQQQQQRQHVIPLLSSLSSSFFSSTSTLTSSTSTIDDTLPNINIDKVVIANRGEIACRIIRTCQKLEIPTVALYSSIDGIDSLHVQMADEAYQIGTGPTPSESYLLQNDILDIASSLSTTTTNNTNTTNNSSGGGTIAIHPGYGFLSENATFCQQILDYNTKNNKNNTNSNNNNLLFVGPSPSAIYAMGDKSQSKKIMDDAGVPTVPGYYDETHPINKPQDTQLLYEKAIEIGFPLLIKAVYGGGGKGMRIVYSADDFVNELISCQREAKTAVGNDLVLLEKYLINPKHIEIQIIGDLEGNIIHCYERDCSLQRRHQKIIEESPVYDTIPKEKRIEMGNCAIQAAKAVKYTNAGTIEFLYDSQTEKFYFCEMNTRLQVEHPITELITGIDLVEWQLRVTAGQTLPIIKQSDIPCNGYAMEARIYAERPNHSFLPSTGTIWYYSSPISTTTSNITNTTTSNTNNTNTNLDNTGLVPIESFTTIKNTGTTDNNVPDTTNTNNNAHYSGIRVDSGIKQNDTINVYYDPMISKVIVYHPTSRIKCIQLLKESLLNYHIIGIDTNINFLISCLQHLQFQSSTIVGGGKGKGQIHTGFLDNNDNLQSILNYNYNNDTINTTNTTTPNTNDNTNNNNDLSLILGTFTSLLHMEQRQQTTTTTTTDKMKNNNVSPWSNLSGSWTLGERRKRIMKIMIKDNEEKEKIVEIECLSNRDGSFYIRRRRPIVNDNDENGIDYDYDYDEPNDNVYNTNVNTNNNNGWIHINGTWSLLDHSMNVIINHTYKLELKTVLKETTKLQQDNNNNEENGIYQIHMWPQNIMKKNNMNNIITPKEYYWNCNIQNPYIYKPSLKGSSSSSSSSNTIIKSPMPGKISSINVTQIGDKVMKGDIVIIMEAMKMEHKLIAPCTGTITKLYTTKINDIVQDNIILVEIDAEKEETEETEINDDDDGDNDNDKEEEEKVVE